MNSKGKDDTMTTETQIKIKAVAQAFGAAFTDILQEMAYASGGHVRAPGERVLGETLAEAIFPRHLGDRYDWSDGTAARGWRKFAFQDSYDNTVTLRESSHVEPHLWISPEPSNARPGADGAHLTPDMAVDLAHRLLAWAEEHNQEVAA